MPNEVLIKNVGGTVETYFVDRRPATCTVTLYSDQGSIKVDAASATVDPVTTTASVITAGTTTVTLADASSVVSGRRYILGTTASTAPQEIVTVKSLASSTATLVHPTLYAHNAGDAFRGGRVYYTVASTAVTGTWFGGYAVFTPDAGDPLTEAVDCSLRKIPDYLCDLAYCYLVFPEGKAKLSARLDVSLALKEARNSFLRDLGGKFQVQCMLADDDLRYGCALRFWLMRRFEFGPDWTEMMDKLQAEYEHEVAKLQTQMPVDGDSDGVTTGPNDGGVTSGRLERA